MKTYIEKDTHFSGNIAQQYKNELQERLDKTAKLCDIRQFNISDILTSEQRAKVEKLLYGFRDIWSFSQSDINLVKGYKQKLLVDPSIKPFAHKTREILVNILPQIKKPIDDLVIAVVLKPGQRDYTSTVVIVKKSDSSFRVCCDLHNLKLHVQKPADIQVSMNSIINFATANIW